MISNISSSSSLLNVFTGTSSSTYINMNAPSSGMLRFNGNSNQMEVFDGGSNTWAPIYGSSASINLDHNAEEALRWAIKKMAEEKEWYKLATNNEAVRIALEQLEQAKTRVELTAILAREHEQKTS